MRALVCLLCLSACAAESTTSSARNPPDPAIVEIGKLQESKIDEASGLARSHREEHRFWTLNDSGSAAVLYALGEDGSHLGSVRMRGGSNIDWEDLASFEFNGRPQLLVADIGDNVGRRKHVTLYIMDEPTPSSDEITPSWQIDFAYPDGPKDAEAVAVDGHERVAYVLSKRTIPARLYSISLAAENIGTDTIAMASFLGTIESIPQPTPEDLERALAEKNWHWQPTAMDFSADGRAAIILTYRAVYLYKRRGDEPWLETLQRSPTTFPLGDIREAESAALNAGSIFLTVEAHHAPIYRIDIEVQK